MATVFARCYAMTDEQISEIYSLGRESFGGQRSFQLQAFLFKMTPINMAKHRNNPNMPFWKMIKEGYDHFEVTVAGAEGRFQEEIRLRRDPRRTPRAIRCSMSAKCPAYAIPRKSPTPCARNSSRSRPRPTS
jgi:murein L,D-transpeptidase YafK